jgi:iron complex outermembrane receptor protein
MQLAAPSGSCVVFAIVAIILCSIFRTQAQDPTPTPQAAGQPGTTIEEVIVTGSNIPTAEEVGPFPVDTYRRDDLVQLGIRSATDLVEMLPAATGASVNENVTNGGNGRVDINLRGILPKETLVLQDARRLAPVGFAGDTVDLNMFPLGLIDHIDILKDGASAVYGPDAVAGVVNIWLIHRFRGVEIYGSYGNTNLGFANDMSEERAHLLAGTGNDKTDIVMFAEVYQRAAIYSRDADISSNADYLSWGGLDNRSGFFTGRVGDFRLIPKLFFNKGTPPPHSAPNAATSRYYVTPSAIATYPDGNYFLFNFAALTPAMAPTDREYLYGSFIHDICHDYLTVFADFKYARTFWDGALAPAPLTPDVFTDATHPAGISRAGISVPIQNPFNPFTVGDYTSPGGFDPKRPDTKASAVPPGTELTTGVRYRMLEAGLRSDKITTNNYLFTAGLKGSLGEFGDYFKTWNWEAGFRHNEDDRVELFSGIVDNNALRAALLDTNPETAFNPFGMNLNKPSVLNKILVTTHHLGVTRLDLEDLKLTGDLFSLPAGPLSFAIGGEHRRESASDNPDALVALGQTTGANNFGPTNGSRDVWAVYWEIRVPITSPAWNYPGFYSLELGYQERYENFSDFGSTKRPKFFFRWQPYDAGLTFRGTYSEAFHAPTLSDLFRGPIQDFPLVVDPRSPATEPQVLALVSGNPDLNPETAYEWTYGTVVSPGKWWSPLQGLTISADFYHIDIRGVTVQLNAQFLVNHEDQFPSLVIRGPSTGPNDPFGPIVLLLLPEENLGRFIEEGWDYEAVYSFDTSRLGHGNWGTLTGTLNGTYLDRAVLQATPDSGEKNVVGKFGGGFLGTAGGGSFTHNRWYASLFYDGPAGSPLGGLDTGFVVHYIGQYWDDKLSTIDGQPRKIRDWTTLDFILNYTFNLSPAPGPNEVPGYAKGNGKNVTVHNGKTTELPPVSTAEYNPCGWRAWLNNTTITLGVNNVMDLPPPFVAGSLENGYDEVTANIKGRTWYVAFKKRF